ncbi:MAG: hypothetical protein AAB776_00985 [Patescibacteria group bacterium]
MYTRPVRFHCTNIGDPRLELWPRYLSNDAYVQAVMHELELCDFIVQQLQLPEAGNIIYLLVGDYRRSRLLALDLKGPRGVVFILKDTGSSDPEVIKTAPANLAIVLNELIVGGHPNADSWLELEAHQNSRLSSLHISPTEPSVELPPVFVTHTDGTYH